MAGDDIVTGQASIVVVPDFRNWQAGIKKQLAATTADFAKAGAEAGKSFADSFKKGLGDPFGPMRPPDQTAAGAKAGGQFADAFRKRVAAALKALPEAKIGASTTAAEQKIKDLRAELLELSGKTIGVDLTDAEALAKIKAIEAELDKLARKSPDVSVKVNAAKASAELAAFSAEVDAVGKKSGGLGSALEGATSGMSGLALAGLSLAPALLPVLAAATGAVIGLSAAAVAGGAAFGLFGLVATAHLTQMKKDLTAVQAANKQANAALATPAGSRTTSQQQAITSAQQLTAQFNKDYGQLAAAQDKLTSSFKAFSSQPFINSVLADGISLLVSALPKLNPLLRLGANAAEAFIQPIQVWVNSGGLARVVTGLTTLAGSTAIPGFVAILHNLAVAFHALAPEAARFAGGAVGALVKLTGAFAQWSQSKGSGALNSLMAGIERNGPAVLRLLGTLAAAVPVLVRGLNPLAPVSLAIATALTSLIANVPPKVITAFAVAFLAWKTATKGLNMLELAKETKLWAAAQWLLDAAMEANPITLIIIGIGLLVAAVILIATKTTWFQTAWHAAWTAIKAAAVDTWNWIKSHWPLLLGILTGPIGIAVLLIVKYHKQIGDAAKAAWKVVANAASAAVRLIRGYAADIWDAVSGAFGLILKGAAKAFGWIPGLGGKLKQASKAFTAWSASVDGSIRGIHGKTVDLSFRLLTNSGGGSFIPPPGKAAGGHIRGPGGGTSDSAGLFALSNGEYVMPARTVAQYGLGFMESLRAGKMAAGGPVGVSVRDVLPPIPSFTRSLTAKIIASLAGPSSFGAPLASGDQGAHGSTAAAAQAIARALLPAYGFGQAQMGPLIALWNQESGWNYRADNPSSGAYGIPQSLPASKMASAGADYLTDPATQIRWGLGYIKGRYGSPSGAWAHEEAFNWYDEGGMLPPGYSTVLNATGKPERVLTDRQWDALAGAAMGSGDGDVNHFHLGDVGGTVESRVRAAVAAAGVAQRRTQRTGRRR